MSGENSNSHTRQEIGRTLELARRERGLSLEAVEQATKIRVRYLRALENENFDVLPAVYMLGSLKTYARHLGLDEAALTTEFKHRQALLQEEQNQEEPHADEPRGLLASLSRLLGAEGHESDEEEKKGSNRVHSPRLYLSFGVVLIFVFVIALASTLRAEDQPAVSQVHETRVSKFPSMIALADTLGDERNTDDENKENQPGKRAKASAKVGSKGEKVKSESGEKNTHLRAQVSSANASASATVSVASSGSASAAARASAGDRPERAAAAEADSAGSSVAADASAGPTARAHAGPVVQRKQAGPIDATRLRNRIVSQAWSVVDDAW
ncbi:MAG TPA: helix-turn-helix domain-containing protein [Rubrobacter sp.]|nr:helix-turn-helix domain-containing protein [Rubrobacter sp.]